MVFSRVLSENTTKTTKTSKSWAPKSMPPPAKDAARKASSIFLKARRYIGIFHWKTPVIEIIIGPWNKDPPLTKDDFMVHVSYGWNAHCSFQHQRNVGHATSFVARNFVNGVLERERLIAEQEEVSGEDGCHVEKWVGKTTVKWVRINWFLKELYTITSRFFSSCVFG